MTNPMIDNTIMAMMNVIRNGGNPVMIAQQMAARDPQIRQFVQMINGKTPAQIRQMVENVSKERGVSMNDVARQFGINIPSDK